MLFGAIRRDKPNLAENSPREQLESWEACFFEKFKLTSCTMGRSVAFRKNEALLIFLSHQKLCRRLIPVTRPMLAKEARHVQMLRPLRYVCSPPYGNHVLVHGLCTATYFLQSYDVNGIF